MGYNTDFTGCFEINNKMTRNFINYINRFSDTRRMIRDVEKIKKVYSNWEDLCFEGNLGTDGEFLAIESTMRGQENDNSVINYNRPPSAQPGLWCNWEITTDEDINDDTINEFSGALRWNGSEKFYHYVAWLRYMIENFFAVKNLELSGVILAVGEETDDAMYIIVDRNIVYTINAVYQNSLDEIKTKFNDNKIILEHIAEVYQSPETIYMEYWDYDDD